jgi:3-isopropylmalate/(R)-2-methylmalate dehydratase small subunit
MKALRRFRSRTVVLPLENIDTDQIIPARFLTTTERNGLGKHAFHGWRYQPDGSPHQEFILNRPEANGCQILVAGDNFGCGSSREHAPWALRDCGFRVVISTRIADIFQGNAVKNGLLPVVVNVHIHQWLVDHPGAELDIDVESLMLTLPFGKSVPFPLDRFSRLCLLKGVDEMGYLLNQMDHIRRYEEMLSWMP